MEQRPERARVRWCSTGSLSLGGILPPFLLLQPKKLLEVLSKGLCFGV